MVNGQFRCSQKSVSGYRRLFVLCCKHSSRQKSPDMQHRPAETTSLPFLSRRFPLTGSWEKLSGISLAHPAVCPTSSPAHLGLDLTFSRKVTVSLTRLLPNGKETTAQAAGYFLALNSVLLLTALVCLCVRFTAS